MIEDQQKQLLRINSSTSRAEEFMWTHCSIGGRSSDKGHHRSDRYSMLSRLQFLPGKTVPRPRKCTSQATLSTFNDVDIHQSLHPGDRGS